MRMAYVYLWIFLTCCIICLQRSPVHGDSCDENRGSFCDRMSQLQMTVDSNTDYLIKWSPHYEFIKRLNSDFEGEISRIVKDVIEDMMVRNPIQRPIGNPNEIAGILLDIEKLQNVEIRSENERQTHSIKLEAIEKEIHGFYKTIQEVQNKVALDILQSKQEILEKITEIEQTQRKELLMSESVAQNKSKKLRDEISRKIEESQKEYTDIFLNVSSQAQAAEKRVNETQQVLISITSVQKRLEDDVRGNITLSNAKMEEHLLDFQTFESNLTENIRAFETMISTLNTKYASSYDFLNRTLQDVSIFSKNAQQSLRNHSLEISGLILKVNEFENRCDYPPRIRYGYVVNMNRSNGTVVTYRCHDNRTLVEEGNVECNFGEWIGIPPVCMENCNTSDLNDYQGLELSTNVIHKHAEDLNIRCSKGYRNPFPERIIKCENGLWNVPNKPCLAGHFDANIILRQIFFETKISCYSYENYNKIQFSRVLENGNVTSLPMNATIFNDQNPAILSFDNVYYHTQIGVFQCEIDDENGSLKIVFINNLLPNGFYPLEAFKLGNIGDTIEFEFGAEYTKFANWMKCFHNGKEVSYMLNRLKLTIRRIKLEDAGIYTCFSDGYRSFMKLTVRKCGENLYGESCDRICPTCYNGGICHDKYGMCVCPAGFTGIYCEIPCKIGFFGSNCSEECRRRDCEFHMFCKPDPFGCVCAAGYKGVICALKCDAGWYGADCKQKCHCAEGPDSCNIHTGSCASGCSEGWEGASCQIECKNNSCANSQ